MAGRPTSSWLEKQTTEEDKTKGFSCHKNASTSTHDKFFNTMEQNGAWKSHFYKRLRLSLKKS